MLHVRTMFRGTGLLVLAVLVLSSVAFTQQKDDIQKMIKEHKDKKDTAPAVGADAPDFKLKMLDSDKTVELSAFEGKKPVVLVFGSYT